MANTFGNSTDTTTSLITSDVTAVVTNQVPFNQATSNFVTTMLNVMNSRRRYLLTTPGLINQVISSNDTNGYAEGFVYTQAEQTVIVTAFKVYANFIYNFFSNLNTKVSSIQGMIGKLDQCKPPTPPARLLQAPQGGQPQQQAGSTQQPQQQAGPTQQPQQQAGPTQQPQQQAGSNQQPQNGQGNNMMGNNTNGGQQGPPQNGQGNNTMGNNTNGGQQGPPQNGQGNNTMGNNTNGGQQGPPQNGQGNNTKMVNNTNGGKQGGKPQGKDGRPQNDVPQGVNNLKSNVTALLSTKTGLWTTLSAELNANLTPDSGYRPNGGMLRSFLQRVSVNGGVLNNEFAKMTKQNETCTVDYLFQCSNGVCDCAENCPAALTSIKSISLSSGISSAFNKGLRYLQSNQNGNQTQGQQGGLQGPPPQAGQKGPPQDLNSDDYPTTYMVSSFCLSGKRYRFTEGKFSISGNLIDFTDGNNANDLGRQATKVQNNCAQSLKSGNSTEKQGCRGNINDDCANKMDNACKATGLYDILVNNPVPSDPLPTQCDDAYDTYTETNCFNWLMPKITKATIVFDYKGFLDLPRGIANSLAAGGSPNGVRLLQTSNVKVVTSDVVAQYDTKAIIPTNIAQVTTTEVSVDSSTVAAAASATNYIQSLSQTTSQVTLSNSFINYSLNLIFLCFVALMI